MISNESNITFIIPTYNSENFIKQAVASIFNGNFNNRDELIIIDDCSQDGTLDILYQLRDKYKNVKILQHNINKKMGIAGVNTGIENSRNDLIFVLDHDNILEQNSIHRLKDYLIKNEADVAAFQELWYFRTNGNPGDTTHKWIYKSGEIFLEDALCGDVWPGPSGNYLFTKESWIKAGRGDEFVSPAIDCWAFGIKQLASGSKMITMPNSFYFHRYGHNSQWGDNIEKINVSLSALTVLTPFLDLIDKDDIEYIFSRGGRYNWFQNLSKRPLKTVTGKMGETGKVEFI